MKEKIEEVIKRLLKLDIVEKVENPSPWVSNIVPAPKKEGKEVRICIDMRQANEAIKSQISLTYYRVCMVINLPIQESTAQLWLEIFWKFFSHQTSHVFFSEGNGFNQ